MEIFFSKEGILWYTAYSKNKKDFLSRPLCLFLEEIQGEYIDKILDDLLNDKKGFHINVAGYRFLDNKIHLFSTTWDEKYDDIETIIDLETFIEIIEEWEKFVKTPFEEIDYEIHLKF